MEYNVIKGFFLENEGKKRGDVLTGLSEETVAKLTGMGLIAAADWANTVRPYDGGGDTDTEATGDGGDVSVSEDADVGGIAMAANWAKTMASISAPSPPCEGSDNVATDDDGGGQDETESTVADDKSVDDTEDSRVYVPKKTRAKAVSAG